MLTWAFQHLLIVNLERSIAAINEFAVFAKNKFA
jgi:hypothetical protein